MKAQHGNTSINKPSGLLELLRKPIILIAIVLAIVLILVGIFAFGGNSPVSSPVYSDESDANTMDPLKYDFQAEPVAEDIKDLFDGGPRDIVSEVGQGVFERYELAGDEGKVYVTGFYSISDSAYPDSASRSTSIQLTFEFVGYKQYSYSCTFDGNMTYSYSHYSRQSGLHYSSSKSISYSGNELLVTGRSFKDFISFSFSGEDKLNVKGWIEGSEGDRFYFKHIT